MSSNNLVLKEQTHTTVLVVVVVVVVVVVLFVFCCCFFWGGDIFGQIVAFCTNPTKFQMGDTTNRGDLLLQRESGIKTDT